MSSERSSLERREFLVQTMRLGGQTTAVYVTTVGESRSKANQVILERPFRPRA